MKNNWYNHIQSMKDTISPTDRYLRDTARDEALIRSFGLKNNTYDSYRSNAAQKACNDLDNIKSSHIINLNNKVLSILKGVLKEEEIVQVQNKNIPLMSPSVLGNHPIFKQLKQSSPESFAKYNKIVDEVSNPIDAKKQQILQLIKAEHVSQQHVEASQNLFIQTFRVSEYFEYMDNILQAPICKPIVIEIAEAIVQSFTEKLQEIEVQEEENQILQEGNVEILEENSPEQLEEELTPKSKQIKEMQEQMAQMQALLAQKDIVVEENNSRIQELENNSQVNSEDMISRSEVVGIMEEHNQIVNSIRQESANKDIELNHSNQTRIMQADQIQDLRQDKTILREQVQKLEGKNEILEEKVKDVEELMEIKNNIINTLNTRVQDLLSNQISEVGSSSLSEIGVEQQLQLAGQSSIINDNIIEDFFS